MPIDFMVAKSKKELLKSHKNVHFPQKIHSYFVVCKNDFINYPAILSELTDIGDTLMSSDDVKQLLNFCNEIQTFTENL